MEGIANKSLNPAVAIAAKELLERVEKRLGPATEVWQVFHLHFLLGWKQSQVGQKLGLRPKQVSRLYEQAWEVLEKEGYLG